MSCLSLPYNIKVIELLFLFPKGPALKEVREEHKNIIFNSGVSEAQEKMSPAMISGAIPADVDIAVAKSQPVEKVKEVEKELTPLEAISHGDVLPGKPGDTNSMVAG
jgi:hypothetical protein